MRPPINRAWAMRCRLPGASWTAPTAPIARNEPFVTRLCCYTSRMSPIRPTHKYPQCTNRDPAPLVLILLISTLGSLSEGLLQSVAWPLVWLIAVQRTGQGNRCARTAPSPSAAQGPYPPDCPLQVLSSHAHCSATRPAVSTSGFNREASGVRVVVLRPPLCELPLTG